MRLLLALLCLGWSLLAGAQQAGKVDEVDGAVKVLDAANRERSVKPGDPVHAGETVVTGSDGELHLAMEDGGHLGIRSNTRMRIEKYKAEGGSDDTSVFNLVQGAMRSVTGWIGKFNARNYAIKTPTATIGVRGTDHETRVIPTGSREGEPGTYDKVNAGETQMRSQYGTTTIRPNQAGFFGFGGRSKPKVLDRVPEFFRPMRSERRFDGLHERVRSNVDTMRKERVQFVRQQRIEQRRAPDANRQQQWQDRKGMERGRDLRGDEGRKFREQRGAEPWEKRREPGGELQQRRGFDEGRSLRQQELRQQRRQEYHQNVQPGRAEVRQERQRAGERQHQQRGQGIQGGERRGGGQAGR